jgi:hypothetical protein
MKTESAGLQAVVKMNAIYSEPQISPINSLLSSYITLLMSKTYGSSIKSKMDVGSY